MWQITTAACTTSATILLLFALATTAQRVAPGVPPQHYQQPQHPQMHPQQQHYQQQGVHVAPGVAPQQYQQYQQVPVQQQQQYQQAPVQQVHQGQPVVQQQQVPQQHQQQHQQQQQQQHHQQQQQHHQQQQAGHHAPHGHHGQQVLHTGNIQDERAHIQEHLQVPIDTSKMSEAELQFHYFKMHDSDNNNKLDGCELIKSLIHWHAEQEGKDKQQGGEMKVFSDEEFIALIDPILQNDDLSRDGFIDYPEYMKAQQKAAAQQQQQQQQQQQKQQQQAQGHN